jgi:diguanylate cyclase (GGDEF)-like protein/PAS domain S-box-containing protein
MDGLALNILLVEDDEDDYILTRDLLSEIEVFSFELDWVTTYRAGLITIEEARHDVYLIDYQLGEQTGLELLSTAIAQGCRGPIILLTGLGDQDVDFAAMQAGAADYLVKGQITPALLERSIRHAVSRAQTLDALRESEERYMLAAQGANDGLWDWNLKTNEIYFSVRWKSMLGWEDSEIDNRPEEWFDRVHADDRDRLDSDIDNHLQDLTTHFENEHRILHRDGTYRWMLSRGLAVRDVNGQAYRIAGSLTDLSRRGAFYDVLTSLPNRALFMDRLERAVKRGKRHKDYLFAVLFLDLDGFKVINDSLGHLIGDQLLIEVAHRLETCLRGADTVARLGGDEFTILLEDIQQTADVTHVATRIHQSLALPYLLSGYEVFITASIGIVFSSTSYDQPKDLLRNADAAMYQAKHLGRGRFEIFDVTMHSSLMERLKLEIDLRRAVERQELQVHYQPIVSLLTGRIVGFEALARWLHPDLGLILPGDFIPIAEETGLIMPIGQWVLQIACRQIKIWQGQCSQDLQAGLPPLSIHVNLSGKQFLQSDLVTQISQTLKDTGLDSACLKLEITEGTMMEDAKSPAETLTQLKTLGVQLQIDDFGTGYSSLSRLHRFPIDSLKIDRSFITGLGTDDENLEIVSTIVSLAHNLGMDVVAEGVETSEQLTYLKQLKCDYGQGHFLAHPLNAEEITELLNSHPQW